jgi:hypothetical protein
MNTLTKSLLGSVLLICLASLTWFSLSQVREGVDPISPGLDGALEEVALDYGPLTPPHPEPSVLPSSQGFPTASRRDFAAHTGVRLVLIAQDGAPIDGANITWSLIPELLLGESAHWEVPNWETIELGTTSAASEGNGAYRIQPPGEDHVASVIWVTHPAYEGTSVLLPTPPSADFPLRIDLEPAEGTKVKVATELGPAVGGTVVQTLHVTDDDRAALSRLGLASRRVFRRAYPVDQDGRTVIGLLPTPQELVGIRGNARSDVYLGTHKDLVRLLLREVFYVEGRVTAPNGMELGPCRVLVKCLQGGFTYLLEERRVDSNGAWKPASIPLLSVNEYSVRVEGMGFVPQEVSIDMPRPGGTVTVDFDLAGGFPIALQVVNEVDAPVAGAWVAAQWRAGTEWGHDTASTGENGRVLFSSCPPGQIHFQASCAGYISESLAQDLNEEPAEPIQIKLDPSGLLTGHCFHQGRPVEEFTVGYRSNLTAAYQRLIFYDREDGSFEVPDAPPGSFRIFAYSDELARSEEVYVTLEPRGTADVVLELRTPLTGVGRVIDGFTQEPLSSATLQLWNAPSGQRASPWGAAVTPGVDGSFEVLGCAPGNNVITIDSPEHAGVSRHVNGTNDPVDFGTIALFPKQDLFVKLEAEQAMDLEACTVSLSGPTVVPTRSLDANGEAVIEDIAPGSYKLILTLADTRPLTSLITLRPGDEWSFFFPVPDHDPVVAHLFSAPGEDLPVVNLEISYRMEDGTDVSYLIGVSSAGEARFFRPPSGTATLDVLNTSGRRLASKRIYPPEVDAPVEIQVASEPTTVRVIDTEGRPVAGAFVKLNLPQDSSGWFASNKTDAKGECTFSGLMHERLLVSLHHGDKGVRMLIPIRQEEHSGEAIELVLDAKDELIVQLVDGSLPLAGIPIELHDDQALAFRLGNPSTNNAGIASHKPVAEGRYLARISYPGLWDTEAIVEPSRTPVPIQVRRLGSVVVAPQQAGVALPSAQVTLRSVEFGTDVMHWHAQNRVRVTPGDGRADASGRVAFEGLPHGEYAWTVELAGGGVQGGVLRVLPERRVTVPLLVP